jgi:hypothetical protein
MEISEKIALGHPPSVESAIGPEETTRRLALNSGRSGQSKRKPLKRRERQSNLNGLDVPVAKVSCEYNRLNYHSQVGSPIELELSRGSKPVLDSASTHTSRKIPDNARIRSFNHRDITLTIEISPVRHAQRFMKMKALRDSGANAIYIDKAYAQKMKLPLTLLADPIPLMEHEMPPDQSPIVPRLVFSFRNTVRELPQK